MDIWTRIHLPAGASSFALNDALSPPQARPTAQLTSRCMTFGRTSEVDPHLPFSLLRKLYPPRLLWFKRLQYQPQSCPPQYTGASNWKFERSLDPNPSITAATGGWVVQVWIDATRGRSLETASMWWLQGTLERNGLSFYFTASCDRTWSWYRGGAIGPRFLAVLGTSGGWLRDA